MGRHDKPPAATAAPSDETVIPSSRVGASYRVYSYSAAYWYLNASLTNQLQVVYFYI